MTGQRELIVFAKEPRPGLVKTRLGRTIGMERAARIYDGADEVHKVSVARRILREYEGKVIK